MSILNFFLTNFSNRIQAWLDRMLYSKEVKQQIRDLESGKDIK